MLKKIRIKNFKCYGPRGADFNLSRINFIYGDNGVGKSTFLQFVELLFKGVDYQGLYSLEEFDRHLFKKSTPEEGITARLRFSKATGGSGIEETVDASFGRVVGNQAYEIKIGEGRNVNAEFWDDVLPKGDGDTRIVRKAASRGGSGGGMSKISLSQLEKIANMAAIASSKGHVDGILSRLEVPYRSVVDNSGNVSEELIHDNDFDVDLHLDEVGTGIDRIFKLAFALNDWKGGILALEEPETNINEEQLPDLVDVLVEETLSHPTKCLMVECHSKLMLEQLAVLVKKGFTSNTQLQIKPEDVSIILVGKAKDGSYTEEASIDKHGTINWGSQSFFPVEGRILASMYGG